MAACRVLVKKIKGEFVSEIFDLNNKVVKPDPTKAAIYVRMSTDHQKYSTENQEDAIREYADKKNLEIIKVYADHGKTELADYSVCTTWGVLGKDYYLFDVVQEKLDFPNLRKAVIVQHSKWEPSSILIEDKASGTQLIQDLRAELRCIRAIIPEGDKIMRMHSQTALIENGSVHIPQAAPWLAKFLHEMATFPNGKNDDQVDSLSQFLIWVEKWRNRPQPRIRSF